MTKIKAMTVSKSITTGIFAELNSICLTYFGNLESATRTQLVMDKLEDDGVWLAIFDCGSDTGTIGAAADLGAQIYR